MVGQIYPTELQLNKANSSDTEAPFLDLNLSITNGFVSSKIYDKRDDFNFEIVNFPFLDGDVPRSPSYGVYISQLIRFARVCSNVDDFNNRNLFLTAKLLKQGYRYHKIRKAFSKFYYRHSELIVKYNIGLKTLLQQGISEPIFYGDLVYKFKRIVGKPNFSDQFKKIVKRYIRDFMMSLSDDKQADVIDAFNTTSRYLDDILNINNVYFENMVSQIYPSELQLNKANASDTEAAFIDLHLSISNDIVSTKIYDKCDDFDFEIVNFPFLDGDVPRSTSYGVYISQLIRFARASSYVTDFNTCNKLLTQKLLKQGYRYHKLRKTFSKFYRRYFDLISKFQVGLKSLLRQGLSEPDFYGDLVYKLKKIVGSNNFSAQFIKIISHYKKIGYNINVLQQTACLVVNPITVGNFAFLFNCTPVGRTSDSMMVPT